MGNTIRLYTPNKAEQKLLAYREAMNECDKKAYKLAKAELGLNVDAVQVMYLTLKKRQELAVESGYLYYDETIMAEANALMSKITTYEQARY